MNILHLSSATILGGGEVYVKTLCTSLAERNINVAVACRPNTPLCKQCEDSNLKAYKLNLANSIDFISVIKLANYCKTNKIDIIHAHLSRDYWIACYVKIIYPKVKIIFTYHVVTPLKQKPQYKFLYKNADKVVAVSHGVKKCITTPNILEEDKIIVIHNGVETAKIAQSPKKDFRQRFGLTNNDKVVGLIGRINPEKAQDIFIRSIPEVLKKFPDTKFVIVGKINNNDLYTRQIQELAHELHIEKSVIFTGFQEDVPPIMKDLDIYIHTSKNEAFGLVITEAMASSIPVIATNSGGVGEIIKDKENGLLVEPNNQYLLANAIIQLLEDENLSNKLKIQGNLTAKNFFDISIITEKMISLYKTILL